MRSWFWLCLLVGAAGSQAFLWYCSIPLGIPGEWIWHRVPSEPDFWWSLLGAGFAAALYVTFVAAGARRLDRPFRSFSRRLELTGWLTGLTVASFLWIWVVQEMAPTTSRIGKAAQVLYYASSSGYFTKARYDEPDPARLLAGYEDLMREGDVLHVGTHPPGLFLVFHGLIAACEKSPLLAFLLDVSQPSSFTNACDIIFQNIARTRTLPPLLASDRRVLWLACLMVMVTASLPGLILYSLVRRTHDLVTAWWTAAFWPAIPAISVFVPKSDVVYAFVGLVIVWTWLTSTDRRSIYLAALSGVIAWTGMMMSLAFVPVFLFTFILAVLCRHQSQVALAKESSPELAGTSQMSSERLKSHFEKPWTSAFPPFRCVLSGLAGFFLPTLLVGWFFRINMLNVWWWNYRNHAGFYQHYTRTYWKWLLVNPIELSYAVGWPVFVLALAALWFGWRHRNAWPSPLAFSIAIVMGALWITGKNSGEAARLWIVFLPWFVWLGGPLAMKVTTPFRRTDSPALIILAIQLIVCALTVNRVNGFVLDI
jgi:hypothetical protein